MTASAKDPAGSGPTSSAVSPPAETEEHFKPTGTMFILAMFVLTLVLLWLSVYVILLSRGVTA